MCCQVILSISTKHTVLTFSCIKNLLFLKSPLKFMLFPSFFVKWTQYLAQMWNILSPETK